VLVYGLEDTLVALTAGHDDQIVLGGQGSFHPLTNEVVVLTDHDPDAHGGSVLIGPDHRADRTIRPAAGTVHRGGSRPYVPSMTSNPTPLPGRRISVLAAAVLLSAASLAVACGDDGDDDEATAAGQAPEAQATTAIDSAPTCDALATVDHAVFNEDVDGAVAGIEALDQHAPDDLRPAIQPFLDAFATDPEASFEGEEVIAAEVATDQFAVDHCGPTLEIRGVDYAYEGVPDELDAGRHVIRFENKSEAGEEYEALLLRKNDDVTEPSAELLAMSKDELATRVTKFVGLVTSPEDPTDVTVVDLPPGEYMIISLLPVGGEPDGPAQTTHGMVAEVSVS